MINVYNFLLLLQKNNTVISTYTVIKLAIQDYFHIWIQYNEIWVNIAFYLWTPSTILKGFFSNPGKAVNTSQFSCFSKNN